MVSWQCVLLRPVLRSVQRRKDMTRSLELERTDFEAIASRIPKRRDMHYEHVEVEGMAAELIRPPKVAEQEIVLHLHGGAFILGSYNVDRVVAARLAYLTGKCVLTPNYRLAPEHPFPAAIEDALKVYRWVLKRGIEPSRVVVTGTSAGGALAIALLVSARAAGDPLPAAAVCLSPLLDLTASGTSVKTNIRSDVMLRPDMLEYVREVYLGTTDPKTPLASPLFADVHGLPPMLIQAGGSELLLDDAVRFANRAREAGIDVELSIWEGMFHGWHALAFFLPEGRQAMEQVSEFIRARLS
jgi:epsilon-lactone hydrolase